MPISSMLPYSFRKFKYSATFCISVTYFHDTEYVKRNQGMFYQETDQLT